MKFPQLPIGSRFTWQGERYCKSGPMTATVEGSGATRMVPRSAVIAPADATDAGSTEPRETSVEAALAALANRLEAYADTLPADARAGLRAALDEAVAAFRATFAG
ncbi:hypothetical protein [Thiohalocapsa sp. ML1]|jgi:hypothetical protein|uniref:hypothetical protein n=1 Tax=Thiohalocapsa sp. ML1 TaxID=1431688 RepID=UPI0007320351|nr:hypothetical protein [Thiohalocapsa sp. ML1]